MLLENDLSSALRQAVKNYEFKARFVEQGRVTAVGDGVVWLEGLPSAGLEEIVELADGSLASIYALIPNRIGAVLLRDTPFLGAGLRARVHDEILEIPTGPAFLGRVIDPLGVPLDGLGPIAGAAARIIDGPATPMIDRDYVVEPLYTGYRIVDSLIPLGHGQRQLLIGDNGTGKSSFALDTVINQRDHGTMCVYVSIGQKLSAVKALLETLKATNAFEYTIVVVAESTALPGLQLLAPYAGCALAESLMLSGNKVLVVYDDLSNHALVHREIALLLKRPPGREAYPGDVFYLHSRLLERSTKLSAEKGGGSMSALAIVETQLGDISAYIPTNLISITDGQIYFDRQLFGAGNLPAIDIRRSVSRIGGAAQNPQLRSEASGLKLRYLQFMEIEVFGHFGAKLQPEVQEQISQGQRLRQLFRQGLQSASSPLADLGWMIAYNEGLLFDLTLPQLTVVIERMTQSLAGESSDVHLSLHSERKSWVVWLKEFIERVLDEHPG